MPDHVKKILNRAYLEDKPYNDIVLHLEREMRLNGLGAPDETTLVPLNTVDVAPSETQNENQPARKLLSLRQKRAQCRKLRKDRYYEIKTQNGVHNTAEQTKPKCETCGKTQKTENCWNGFNAANDPRKRRHEFALPTNQINDQPIPTT